MGAAWATAGNPRVTHMDYLHVLFMGNSWTTHGLPPKSYVLAMDHSWSIHGLPLKTYGLPMSDTRANTKISQASHESYLRTSIEDYPWTTHGQPMGYPLDTHWLPIGNDWKVMDDPWATYELPMGHP